MKKTILVIDACVRQEESRTRKLLTTALDTMKVQHPDWKFEVLDLNKMDLKYWTTDTLKARDEFLMKRDYTAPVFQYGNQFREADGIVVAAPFWDLSIPAVLKVYIENISADGITFKCDESGMHGICKGQWMLFLTTRGGIWQIAIWSLEADIWKLYASFLGLISIIVCMQTELMSRNWMERRFWRQR